MPSVIKIPGATISGSIPAPPPAHVLPPAGTPGVIGLFEPGHPLSSNRTDVPATGTFFNDIAEEWTALTLGGPSNGFQVTNNVPSTGNQAFVERTGKNALHIASAHSGATSPYPNFSIGLGNARRTYLDARTAAGDVIYISQWTIRTRPAKTGYGAGVPVSAIRKSFNLADLYAADGIASAAPWTWPQAGAARTVGATTRQNGNAHFAAVAAGGAIATFTTTNGFILHGARDAATVNQLPSLIHIRTYMENLSTSGRPYAEVEAADLRDFDDQVRMSLGRYYGETWTEPTSRLP